MPIDLKQLNPEAISRRLADEAEALIKRAHESIRHVAQECLRDVEEAKRALEALPATTEALLDTAQNVWVREFNSKEVSGRMEGIGQVGLAINGSHAYALSLFDTQDAPLPNGKYRAIIILKKVE